MVKRHEVPKTLSHEELVKRCKDLVGLLSCGTNGADVHLKLSLGVCNLSNPVTDIPDRTKAPKDTRYIIIDIGALRGDGGQCTIGKNVDNIWGSDHIEKIGSGTAVSTLMIVPWEKEWWLYTSDDAQITYVSST